MDELTPEQIEELQFVAAQDQVGEAVENVKQFSAAMVAMLNAMAEVVKFVTHIDDVPAQHSYRLANPYVTTAVTRQIAIDAGWHGCAACYREESA